MGTAWVFNDIPPNAILATKREYETTYCDQRQLYTSMYRLRDYGECKTTHCHASTRTGSHSEADIAVAPKQPSQHTQPSGLQNTSTHSDASHQKELATQLQQSNHNIQSRHKMTAVAQNKQI
mmetsp:Transcript_49611/g.60032  ORF Transcript_49611/g.60032 Transcript_49611/m.60032 type:complete len:122 (-) Transcript_49611:37-402(-)